MSKLILTEQSAAPTAPAASSGKWLVYATDGKLWAMDDIGTEYDLTTGGAGGEDLAATLALGNTTGGIDLVLSDGDVLRGESGAGVAGDVTLRGGTSSTSGSVDGGDFVLIPGAGIGGNPDGVLVLKDAAEVNEVAFKTIGPEQLRIGTTLPFEYDGTTGELNIPTAIVFEEAGAPATGSTEGAVFVASTASGLTAGHLYYAPPGGDPPIDISNPAVAADTLQAAYDAGNTIALAAGTPVELTAGDASGPTASLLAFKMLSGDGLFAVKHAAATRARLEGAVGTAVTAGTSIELVGGAAVAGAGNRDGGSIYLRPGTKVNSGTDGSIAFLDVAAAREVDVYVDPSATYPAPVLLSRGTGTVGATLGPVVNALNVFSPSALGTHIIPNNASVCLYNPNSGLGVGARNITLPANPVTGQTVVVKDVAGNAGTYNVTIAGSGGTFIDNAPSVVLNSNWKAFTFVFNQNWYII